MRLTIRKREVGQRFGTSYVLETEDGQVVASSDVEPLNFATGARALTVWAEENGHTVTNPVTGEPRWA